MQPAVSGAGVPEDTGTGAIGRRIASLAVPVLPVLAAEPIYLLIDGIVVGRLGSSELAALGAGSLVLLVLGTQMNFLAYGTTARSARLYGAGKKSEAIAEGVQATWIAVVVGITIVAAVLAVAHPLMSLLAKNPDVAARARQWLQIAIWGIPLILISSAGHGWMRGVQRVRTPLVLVAVGIGVSALGCVLLVPGLGPFPALGLEGSAVANLAGQAIMAGGFIAALWRAHSGSIAPRLQIIVIQMRLGGNLIIRTASFQITFAVATTTAAAAGVTSLAAHHLAQQLWSLYALVLDSVAIAAQSLVGAALGAGLMTRARAIVRSVIWWSLALGVLLAVLTALLRSPLASLLTSSADVTERLEVALIGIVLVLIPAAIVFGLDGVLLGAGDAAYLRTTTVLAAVVGFLPVLALARWQGWGLAGIWAGMGVFIVLRLLAVSYRVRGTRWAVTGAQTVGGVQP